MNLLQFLLAGKKKCNFDFAAEHFFSQTESFECLLIQIMHFCSCKNTENNFFQFGHIKIWSLDHFS